MCVFDFHSLSSLFPARPCGHRALWCDESNIPGGDERCLPASFFLFISSPPPLPPFCVSSLHLLSSRRRLAKCRVTVTQPDENCGGSRLKFREDLGHVGKTVSWYSFQRRSSQVKNLLQYFLFKLLDRFFFWEVPEMLRLMGTFGDYGTTFHLNFCCCLRSRLPDQSSDVSGGRSEVLICSLSRWTSLQWYLARVCVGLQLIIFTINRHKTNIVKNSHCSFSKWRLQVASLVQPTVQNLQTLHFLSEMTKQTENPHVDEAADVWLNNETIRGSVWYSDRNWTLLQIKHHFLLLSSCSN